MSYSFIINANVGLYKCLSMCLSVSLSVYMFLYVCMFVCLSVCRSASAAWNNSRYDGRLWEVHSAAFSLPWTGCRWCRCRDDASAPAAADHWTGMLTWDAMITVHVVTSAFRFESIQFTRRIDSLSQKIRPFDLTTTWMSLYAQFADSWRLYSSCSGNRIPGPGSKIHSKSDTWFLHWLLMKPRQWNRYIQEWWWVTA